MTQGISNKGTQLSSPRHELPVHTQRGISAFDIFPPSLVL